MTLVLACGARTDLDRGEPQPPDGGPDAFVFDGFPCRWSLGSSVEIARGERFTRLTGAVHPVRDQVVVMASRDGGERVGGRIALSIRPELLAPLEGFEGEIFAGSNGWVRQDGERCALVEHDETFAEGVGFSYGDSSACLLTQSELGRIESVSGDSGIAFSLTYPGPDIEMLGLLSGADSGSVVRDPDRGALGAVVPFDSVTVTRVLASGVRETIDLFPAGLPSAALDRIEGRTMLLYFDSSAWQLVHIGWDGPLELIPHADIASLPRPIGRLRSNETEALIPLRDGTMAFFPLPMSRVRFTDPVVEDRQVEAMEIILRPGQSAGGLLFAHREPSGESVLVFRSLVCNR